MIIIRHARSLYNLRKSESLDSPISEFGKIQASGVGKFLQKKFPEISTQYVCYTSPFLRCLQTANYIQKTFGVNNFSCSKADNYFLRVKILPELSEHLELDQKVAIPRREESFPDFIWGDYKETVFAAQKNQEFLERVVKAKDIIVNETSNEYIKPLIITHGTTKNTLIKLITEKVNHVPVWDFSYDNCSISWIQDGRLVWNGRNLHHEPEAGY